jgi:hypothetical protein
VRTVLCRARRLACQPHAHWVCTRTRTASMHVHSIKPIMNAVANTGGMSEKPTNACDIVRAIKRSPTPIDCAFFSPGARIEVLVTWTSCQTKRGGRAEVGHVRFRRRDVSCGSQARINARDGRVCFGPSTGYHQVVMGSALGAINGRALSGYCPLAKGFATSLAAATKSSATTLGHEVLLHLRLNQLRIWLARRASLSGSAQTVRARGSAVKPARSSVNGVPALMHPRLPYGQNRATIRRPSRQTSAIVRTMVLVNDCPLAVDPAQASRRMKGFAVDNAHRLVRQTIVRLNTREICHLGQAKERP